MKSIIKISMLLILICAIQKTTAQIRDTVDGSIINFLMSPPKSGSVVVFPKLKKFEGTWYVKQDGVEVTLQLDPYTHPFKKEPTFYIQLLRGGVKYVKNGEEIYDSLNDMNIIADMGADGKADVIEVLISEKGKRFRHPVDLKLKNRTTIEVVANPSGREGIKQMEKYNNLNGLILKKVEN